jgi:hypothetical protein
LAAAGLSCTGEGRQPARAGREEREIDPLERSQSQLSPREDLIHVAGGPVKPVPRSLSLTQFRLRLSRGSVEPCVLCVCTVAAATRARSCLL